VPGNVVTTGSFPGVPERRTLVIDAATSFYFHREADGVLMGMGAPEERSSFDVAPDERFIEERILPTAVRVFPPLADAGIRATWAGLYEMTPDRHPIIGPSPVEGFFLANGFSGHGFQHAPVVGKLLAEMIVDGHAATLDISALGFERFAQGDLVREGHVV
jgi:sarcosine oxidase subunit beta